jgi:hypothetical protein
VANGNVTVNVDPQSLPALSACTTASVQLHELPHEGETKAEAAVRPRGRAIRLPERLEHVGKKIGVIPWTRVLHHDVHRPAPR